MVPDPATTTARPPLPDQASRDLIERDLATSLLVEAAAGTGKTTSMVRRMVRLLAEGACTIETMAAVTFTRKAAAELRSRFQVELERQAADPGTGAEEAERLRAGLARIDRCFVGTIHSFCGRILRERPIEAGVDVAFEELDENEEFRLRRRAWDEHVAGMYARRDPLLRKLDQLGLRPGDIEAAFLGFADYPDVDAWPVGEARLEAAAIRAAARALREYARHMEALRGDLPDRTGDDLAELYREVPRLVRLRDLRRVRHLMEVLEEFKPHKKGMTGKVRSWPKGMAKIEAARWLEFVEQHARPLVQRWRERRYEVVLAVLKEAVATAERLRREQGALNFQDLLMKAAALLRDKPHVRRAFRRRFTHLLVDEFQDTDPIQAEVMCLLTADDPAETEWRRCRPVPGSLFVVGDPKQSIYRFRRADIVTYTQVRRIIEAHGRVVPLTANFRSVRTIIDWANTASAELFPAAADEFAPADAPMQAARPDGAEGMQGVAVLDLAGGANAAILAEESDLIARTVRDMIDRRLPLERSARELARELPPHVTPGDFMIVTWKRFGLSVYAQRLRELGIACEVTGGTAVNTVEEVALLHAALAAILQPENPVTLVGALRSALFGVSDDELYRFRRAGGWFDYRVDPPDAAPASITEAFDHLRRGATWLRRQQPVPAIERIAADLGLFGRAAAAIDGADRAGALAKAIELLRGADRREWSASALSGYLGDLVRRNPDSEEKHDGVPARPYAGGAVRIMNLHQVKGLEAPIVFLAAGPGGPGGGVNAHIDRSGGRVAGYLAIEPKKRTRRGGFKKVQPLAHPPGWDHWKEQEQRFLDAERKRLLYVAATRAGVRLIVSRDGRKERAWAPLDVLPGMDALEVPDAAPAPPVASTNGAPPAPQPELDSIARRWQEAVQPTYVVAAMKQVALAAGRTALQVDGAPAAGHRSIDAAPAGGVAPPDDLAVRGAEWGDVLHVLLEAAAVRPDADLRALARSALAEHELDPALAEQATAVVGSVMGGEVWRRARAARQRLVEVPIQFAIAAGEQGCTLPTIMRGVIDLAFREERGWVIVDYKSDAWSSDRDIDRLAAHYAPQIQSYAAAWTKITGEPVAETGLLFVRGGRYVRLP